MEFRQAKLRSCFRGDEYGVSSLVFDPQEELLWAATFGGHVTSFLGCNLELYTSVQAHHSDIRQLELTPAGVLSVADSELRYTARTGLPLYTIRDEPQLVGMNCLLYISDTDLLVGCQSGHLASVDMSTMQVTSQMGLEAGVCLLKASEHLVCTADVTGQVYLQAPGSLQVVHKLSAHSAGMSDMDVVGHCLVTCGLTHRYGQLCVDPELSVIDLRMLHPLAPLPAPMAQPMLVKAMPSLPSTALLLSQLGKFQFVDIRGLLTPANMAVHQLQLPTESAMPCACDVSPSTHCLAFGDSCGQVHLWACGQDSIMNSYAQPSVLPDRVESCPELNWGEGGQPLSVVPLPVSSGPLLSDWPHQNSRFMRRRAPVIDPRLLATMKMHQFVGHAPKPDHLRRNQVPYDLKQESRATVPESPMMRETNPLSLIPKPYRQVEIKYSKLGIETFDFAHYNETNFAGLEIHIPNAYCNSMLQVLYFLEPLRHALLSHICSREFCLACELHFLFLMLDSSTGKSCQATNFLRAFRTLREASALGLLISREDEEQKADLGKLIQNWSRFVLQELHQVEGEPEREFWRQQQSMAAAEGRSWLPHTLAISLAEDGQVTVREGDELDTEGSLVYELSMVVAHVKESWMEAPGNLVAHIRISPFYHSRKEIPQKFQWYLFNDFAITPTSQSAVAQFSLEWLTPCLLLYTQKNYDRNFRKTQLHRLEPSVLLAETHSPRPLQSPTVHTSLSLSELPERGDLVGIDAEFVTLNQGEAEVRSDGTHMTVKPSQLSVARITAVRGKPPMEGFPFIDDYIAHSEQVVDYVTQYSGIKPGDLDANRSSKHLTTLKAAYLKLLFLLQRGVQFVGHGLKKDFRVINILVPDSQVLDTVELFHLPKQRYVSLKFLAWFYLQLHVQDGAHDSAEDAKTALQLYRVYQRLQSEHRLTESLGQLYEAGRRLNWQVPAS